MPANRRRHINALPGMKLLVGFTVGALLLAAGLGYVYCQNQLHRAKDETGKLEKELQDLRMKSEALAVRITRFSSAAELQKKRDNGFFKLSEIKAANIVLLPATLKSPAGDETQVRPVANERKEP